MSGREAPVPGFMVRTTGKAQMVFLGRSDHPSSASVTERFDSLLGGTQTSGIPLEGQPELILNQQVHSSRIVEAKPDGPSQAADGLWTRASGLAPGVITADCVPILLVHEAGVVAAIHAGWRGLAQRIPAAAVTAMRLAARGGAITAVLGPAIRGCCYEVGWQVAHRIAAVSGTECVVPPPSDSKSGRPHVDLGLAARHQLVDLGIEDVTVLPVCTHCDPNWYSYRRDGSGGHNLSAVWSG